jgi:opacity protein-like surface antigen
MPKEGNMKTRMLIVLATFLLIFTVASMAQDTNVVPKAEIPIVFSFVNVHPNLAPITSFNIYGGGGSFIYNVTHIIGIKADFNGYTQGSGVKNQLTRHDIPVTGSVSGNLFLYTFGPQIKKHSGKFQPFGEALFGAAHSNTFGTLITSVTGFRTRGANNNAFAMQFGLGVDIPVANHVQIRPAEVDYLYTQFGLAGSGYKGTQNNFKYSGGLNFTFGSK